MSDNKLKNMVVLKNLPSNVVEEAIVILKPNVKVKRNSAKSIENKVACDNRECIINEAQSVINNYISKLETGKNNKSNKKDYFKFKLITIIIGILIIIGLILIK